jgi:hypothetical protein
MFFPDRVRISYFLRRRGKKESIENYQYVKLTCKPPLFHTSQYGKVDQCNYMDTSYIIDGGLWMDEGF